MLITYNVLSGWITALAMLFITTQPTMTDYSKLENTYRVRPLSGSITIDANWDKAAWKDVEAVELTHYMGEKPLYSPVTHAKLMYDSKYIYGIFRVQDRHVQSKVTEINGAVSTDSCVEFFFSPDTDSPLTYFNLEINAGGVPLLHYVTQPRKTYQVLEAEQIRKIEIAHSMPQVVDPEIVKDTLWTIEYKVPLSMLAQHGTVTTPAPGVKWKANFYKTGSRTGNPHYFTWNLVDNPRPDFHLPQYFGTLIFE
ncbi:carbohydrate-binding family 9-like protein [Lunatimonas salinarum]|uniref:carbohydrate-binding family 9-like protein n=1 Tax=Lunatimonas salinarum TaxID=1774590 RepID=UPI001ADF4D77|nr:carbohydrate-binding family 9-like protein [Lunatimonas salinarum]